MQGHLTVRVALVTSQQYDGATRFARRAVAGDRSWPIMFFLFVFCGQKKHLQRKQKHEKKHGAE